MGEVEALHVHTKCLALHAIHNGDTTGAALARAAGLSQAHFSNWLNGRKRLSLPSLDRVTTALLPFSGFEQRQVSSPNPRKQAA